MSLAAICLQAPNMALHLQSAACRVVDLSHDQDSTDLTKCLQCAQQRLDDQGADCQPQTTVLVLGESLTPAASPLPAHSSCSIRHAHGICCSDRDLQGSCSRYSMLRQAPSEAGWITAWATSIP